MSNQPKESGPLTTDEVSAELFSRFREGVISEPPAVSDRPAASPLEAVIPETVRRSELTVNREAFLQYVTETLASK